MASPTAKTRDRHRRPAAGRNSKISSVSMHHTFDKRRSTRTRTESRRVMDRSLLPAWRRLNGLTVRRFLVVGRPVPQVIANSRPQGLYREKAGTGIALQWSWPNASMAGHWRIWKARPQAPNYLPRSPAQPLTPPPSARCLRAPHQSRPGRRTDRSPSIPQNRSLIHLQI